MAEIIQFPTREIRFSTELEERLTSQFSSHPELAQCIKKSFFEIYSLCETVSPKAVKFTIPGDVTDEQVSTVHEQVKQIILDHETAVLTLLKRIAEQSAELCLLAHNQSPESDA